MLEPDFFVYVFLFSKQVCMLKIKYFYNAFKYCKSTVKDKIITIFEILLNLDRYFVWSNNIS